MRNLLHPNSLSKQSSSLLRRLSRLLPAKFLHQKKRRANPFHIPTNQEPGNPFQQLQIFVSRGTKKPSYATKAQRQAGENMVPEPKSEMEEMQHFETTKPKFQKLVRGEDRYFKSQQ